uniref:DUF5648 domain-containing protein n=1 Tax=Lotharella globosa TaxID=91324 RepID=A0A7S3YV44_9EUKA
MSTLSIFVAILPLTAAVWTPPAKKETASALESNFTSEAGPVPLYRFWNDQTFDHFYTTDRKQGAAKRGYSFEKIECKLLGSSSDGAVALHKYSNPTQAHDHLYTVDANLVGSTQVGQMGNFEYVYEGVAGYCYPTAKTGTVALHRYWQPNIEDHFYTTDPDTIGTTTPGEEGNSGYKYEKVECYVLPA